MSSCSFASYLSMRTSSSSTAVSSSSVAVASAQTAHPSSSSNFLPHAHHLHHFSSSIPPSISPFDLTDPSPAPTGASPHKRQRNTSPDHSAASSASTLRAEAKSYFGFTSPEASTASLPPTSSPELTPVAPRSILCTPSSPLSCVYSYPPFFYPFATPLQTASTLSCPLFCLF
jgi:hypothetical protein